MRDWLTQLAAAVILAGAALLIVLAFGDTAGRVPAPARAPSAGGAS